MNLTDLRLEIDEIDEKLIELIAKRLDFMPMVINYKIKHNLSILQNKREKEILDKKKNLAKELNISAELIEKIFKLLMKESKRVQKSYVEGKIINKFNFGKLKLKRKKIKLKLPIYEIFKSIYANYENFYFLESLGEKNKLAKYSYMGFDPAQTFRARENKLWIDNKLIKTSNPMDKLKELVPLDTQKYKGFHGGLIGYLSYESLRYYENLSYFKKNHEFYDFEYGLYLDGLRYDRETQELEYYFLDKDRSDLIYETLETKVDLEPFKAKLVSQNQSDTKFKQSVKKILKHIKDGDLYQGVVSNRYQYAIQGASLDFYEKLRSINPSPFMFFVKNEARELIGASPELLTKVEENRIETYPIAGTRKRGQNKIEDKKLEKELVNDTKERSEHMMLVDMSRNDLGRVCDFKSIKVDELMMVKKFSHVQHLVSQVSGKLNKETSLYDAVMANLPMGTVCGAPRLEAIKIINSLEPTVRGPYSGAVGYFGLNNECMHALTIRTLYLNGSKAYTQAGAGIVYDSVPKYELKEVQKKLRGLNTALGL